MASGEAGSVASHGCLHIHVSSPHYATFRRLCCYCLFLLLFIGVGAQSTLRRQDSFARKYVHEKLTKCPNFTLYLPEKLTKYLNFTWYMPEKINKMPEFYMIFAWKIFFQNFGGHVLPCLPPSPTPMLLLDSSQTWLVLGLICSCYRKRLISSRVLTVWCIVSYDYVVVCFVVVWRRAVLCRRNWCIWWNFQLTTTTMCWHCWN